MSNADAPRALTLTAQNQFFSCFEMLETLVAVCPDAVWQAPFNEVPFWYQVYHTVYFVDYWFREDASAPARLCMAFDARIPPEFEHDVPDGVCVSREKMRLYGSRIREKVGRIFASLDDAALRRGVLEDGMRYSWLDIVMTQTRHIMYNVGYCNGILRSLGLEESDWYAYNEQEP